jgi:hypothetical protein
MVNGGWKGDGKDGRVKSGVRALEFSAAMDDVSAGVTCGQGGGFTKVTKISEISEISIRRDKLWNAFRSVGIHKICNVIFPGFAKAKRLFDTFGQRWTARQSKDLLQENSSADAGKMSKIDIIFQENLARRGQRQSIATTAFTFASDAALRGGKKFIKTACEIFHDAASSHALRQKLVSTLWHFALLRGVFC